MINFIWKMLPRNYKFSVVFKKAGMIASKALTGVIIGTAVGKKLSPEHVEIISTAITVTTTAGLEAIHDWARMKWPNAKWL